MIILDFIIYLYYIEKIFAMIKLRIAEILQEKGITKTAFAEMMGVKKQNVNLLLETSNINKLIEIAEKLEVHLTDLWIHDDDERSICGYIEYEGRIYAIKNIEDFNAIAEKIDAKK